MDPTSPVSLKLTAERCKVLQRGQMPARTDFTILAGPTPLGPNLNVEGSIEVVNTESTFVLLALEVFACTLYAYQERAFISRLGNRAREKVTVPASRSGGIRPVGGKTHLSLSQ
jgi:hypothetical protein